MERFAWRGGSIAGLLTAGGEALDQLAVDQNDEAAAVADAVFDLTSRRAVVGPQIPQLRFRPSRLVADGAAVVRRCGHGWGSHATNMASLSKALQPLHQWVAHVGRASGWSAGPTRRAERRTDQAPARTISAMAHS